MALSNIDLKQSSEFEGDQSVDLSPLQHPVQETDSRQSLLQMGSTSVMFSVGAKDFGPHEHGLRGVTGFPDPFAVATIGGEQTRTTSVIKKTLNPYWNEGFDM